jgi:hypothetical protein
VVVTARNNSNNNNNNNNHLGRWNCTLLFRPTRALGTRLTSSNDAQYRQDLLWRGFEPPPLPNTLRHHHSQLLYRFLLSLCSLSHEVYPHIVCLRFLDQSRVLTQKPHSARKYLRRMLIFPYFRRLPSANVACARFRAHENWILNITSVILTNYMSERTSTAPPPTPTPARGGIFPTATLAQQRAATLGVLTVSCCHLVETPFLMLFS